MRILVAEDDAVSRIVLVQTLKSMGFEVVETANGQELVDEFSRNPSSYDLIITDIMMPVMNGLQAVRELKKIKMVTCIALTAFDHDTQIFDCHGKYIPWTVCDFFMKKPLSRIELIHILEKIKDPI